MCLPGTVEKVQEQTRSEDGPRLDRRAVLLGGVGAAVAATFPARATAGRRPHRLEKKRLEDLTHVFTEGFPVFAFEPPARETLITIPAGGFYAQKWTFGEHSGTHMDAPGHFVIGGRLPGDHTTGVDRADRGHRHLEASGRQFRRGRHGRRSAALRAGAWAHPGRRARLHGLRLGAEGGRPARVQGWPLLPQLP